MKIKSISIIVIVFLIMVSCNPSYYQNQETSKKFNPKPLGETTKKNMIEYLDSSKTELDIIEGIWVWDDNSYEAAIVKNNFNIFPNYDYVGILTDTRRTDDWSFGEIKFLLKKTADLRIYSALYYMLDKSEKGTTFIMTNDNMLEFTLTNIFNKSKSILIRSYASESNKAPKKKSQVTKANGTGFFISNKIIVTNYHVVENSSKIEITMQDKLDTYLAKIKLKDVNNDIAILELEDVPELNSMSNEIPFIITDANYVKIGEEVFTLGFPLGDILGAKSRLSTGRINSIFGLQDDPRLFQISNPLQPGNSGGPLFNNNGELVGIVVSSLNAKYFYENIGIIPQNVNFAIKSTYLLNLISMIPEGDKILKRINSVKQGKIEGQIEQLSQFVVQIKVN